MTLPTINPAFKLLIPSLAPGELAQLEQNLLADGCRDPLVTWNGVLLDGHHRLEICQRLKIPFETRAVELADDNAAQVWIIRNQFGRRNLAPFTRIELALKLEPLLAQMAKARQGTRTDLPQNSAECFKPAETREQLAKLAGVSHDTLAKGKVIVEHAGEQTKDRLRRNEISIHRVAKDIKEKIQRDTRAEARLEPTPLEAFNPVLPNIQLGLAMLQEANSIFMKTKETMAPVDIGRCFRVSEEVVIAARRINLEVLRHIGGLLNAEEAARKAAVERISP